MIVLLSPAKTQNFNCKLPDNITPSIPYFAKETWKLVEILKNYSEIDLEKLMNISPKLALLNSQRFQEFNQDYKNAKPCIYVYNGDVYSKIEVESYSYKQLEFANKKIRIISGLYGLLKPFDLIQAYRLEMYVPLNNSRAKNLYEFWDDKITQKLNEEQDDIIINLASQEYSNTIISNKCKKELINIRFKENVKGEYKIIGIHAKRARGVMANFIVTNFIETPESLKDFNLEGYSYCSKSSKKTEYIFVRN